MKTLLDKAREQSSESRHTFNEEQIDLVVAWAKREISMTAATKVAGYSHGAKGSWYLFAARALAQYVREQK